MDAADGRGAGDRDAEVTRKEKISNAVLALARLIGRRIAREEFARRQAANDNQPLHDTEARPPGEKGGAQNGDTS